jgi:hypothetical protein
MGLEVSCVNEAKLLDGNEDMTQCGPYSPFITILRTFMYKMYQYLELMKG